MDIDFQKVADTIEKSSPEIKNLMFSVELSEKVNDIAFENNLDEETALKLTDEVGYVILNLKSRFSFFDSLVEIGIDKSIADPIAKEVESKIFSELDKIKNNPDKPTEIQNQTTPQVQPKENQTQSGVGGSFEQIILNQAKAMQPAVASSELGYGVAKPASEVPHNLPTSEEQKEEKPKAIHNYIGESDPYRESVE